MESKYMHALLFSKIIWGKINRRCGMGKASGVSRDGQVDFCPLESFHPIRGCNRKIAGFRKIPHYSRKEWIIYKNAIHPEPQGVDIFLKKAP
jgi:hypothetical protein